MIPGRYWKTEDLIDAAIKERKSGHQSMHYMSTHYIGMIGSRF
jgi:hypothetical protein